MRSLPILVPLSLLIALPAAAQETRELDAHEHGHGSLRIAVEGREVAMELEAPGADIVGFEHEAESEADRAAVEEARDVLSDPLSLLALPEVAGCEVVSADVELELEGGHEHDDEEAHDDDDHAHDEHGDEEHGDEEHGDEEHAHDERGAQHSEFHAAWALTCADPSEIDSIGFPYFQTFPNAQELEVQVVSDRGARSFEVERDEPMLSLDGGL